VFVVKLRLIPPIPPAIAVQNLIDAINALPLPVGAQTSLTAPLGQAIALLTDGNPANDGAVCGKLSAFINQVNAKVANGTLTSAQAAPLIAAANAIKASLGCP
jgi:hypothetical protein